MVIFMRSSTMFMFFCVQTCLWGGIVFVLTHHGHRLAPSNADVL